MYQRFAKFVPPFRTFLYQYPTGWWRSQKNINSCMKTPSIMGLDIDISACTVQKGVFLWWKSTRKFCDTIQMDFVKTDCFFDRCFQRNCYQSDRYIQMCKCFMGGGDLADAILDRILSKSKTIQINENRSMRNRKKKIPVI